MLWDNKDHDFFRYEFNEICINDCYHISELGKLLGPVGQVVDIGANQGLFALAARQTFPNAIVHCYEPNPNIMGRLRHNGKVLDATVYEEAVTREDCRVALSFGETDLHSTTTKSADGGVAGTAFRKVIERAGGTVDLLKLDCEGAEWELFEDTESWNRINCLTMEYHLWAKPGSTPQTVLDKLNDLGFKVLHHNPLSDTFGLLTAVKTRRS